MTNIASSEVVYLSYQSLLYATTGQHLNDLSPQIAVSITKQHNPQHTQQIPKTIQPNKLACETTIRIQPATHIAYLYIPN